MATKIIRLVSDQTGPWNPADNTVDITIPSYISYTDMTRSCIVLNMYLQKNDGTAKLGVVQDAAFNNGLDARALLKTVTVANDQGVIEQIPAANVLYMNLDQTQHDFEDLQSREIYGYSSSPSYRAAAAANKLGVFVRKVKDGSRSSTSETELKIPLSSIFGVLKMKQFPNNLFGNLKISLEFEDDTVNVVPRLFKKVKSHNVLLTADNTPGNALNQSGAGNTAGGPYYFSANPTSVTGTAPDGSSNPFWVGQGVTLSGATGGNEAKTIKSIEYDATLNAHKIMFNELTNTTLAAGNGNTLTPTESAITNLELSYVIQDVVVELYQYILSPAQQQSLNAKMKRGVNMDFTTYSLERQNMTEILKGQHYTRQFELEPNTINVFALMTKHFEDAAAESIPLYAVNQEFGPYRWRLGAVDTTTRDVVPYQSLYYDRLMATLSNGYMKIKNLNLSAGKYYGVSIASLKNDTDIKSYIIPTPVPRSDGYQTIQLRMLKELPLSTQLGSAILHLYKQVQKTIKLKPSGIEVM